MNRETFEQAIEQNFTALSSDGKKVVELKKGGKDIPVTWGCRLEYSSLLYHYYLHESDTAVGRMRRGISKVCPPEIFRLFTWEEFEFRVCGNFGIDLEMLRRHTVYKHPLVEESPIVEKLWSVLDSFSFEEQTLFLRYIEQAWH